MKEWKEYKIGEICSKVASGGTPLTSKKEYYEGGTIPWLKTTEVHKEIIRKTDTFITEEGLKNSSAKLIPANSIIVAMYGDGGTAGKAAITKIPLTTNQACCNLTIDGQKADYGFVFYYLKINYDNIVNLKTGGSQQNLNALIIKSFPIFLPPLLIQKQISSILSAYDDLIETSNQRIKLLEETAQQLYKEWFVRMRFPDFKKVKFVKGVPEGWEVKKLEDLVTTQYGYTASATNENVGLKFLRITDIADTKIDWDNVPNCVIPEKEKKKYLLENGDIVVARTGATVGFAKRLNKYHQPTVFASYLVRLKPKEPIFNYYLGIIIESEGYKEYIQTVASGSAQPQANAGLMTGFYLFKPTASLIEKFNLIVEPMFDQKEILEQQNTHLRQIRDRLLPRLISGKLAVKSV